MWGRFLFRVPTGAGQGGRLTRVTRAEAVTCLHRSGVGRLPSWTWTMEFGAGLKKQRSEAAPEARHSARPRLIVDGVTYAARSGLRARAKKCIGLI